MIIEGAGVGYKDEDGTTCMTRCFKCGRENYAIAVSTGKCAFCGYDPNKAQLENKIVINDKDGRNNG